MDLTENVYYFVLNIEQKKLYGIYLFLMFTFVIAGPLISTIISSVAAVRGDRSV